MVTPRPELGAFSITSSTVRHQSGLISAEIPVPLLVLLYPYISPPSSSRSKLVFFFFGVPDVPSYHAYLRTLFTTTP